MAADQQFCLRWNNHQSTLISVFDTLLENGTLVDCTLAAEGQYLKAHKVVLSACSPYMETLLSQNYDKHPILILKDVKFTELKSMMDYMYRGEVNISQDQLGTFLKAAESLQIKGLSENGEGDARDVGSTNTNPPPPRRPPATRPEPEAAQSPAHRSRDGSVSPSSRKRRRLRRNSDDGDNHIESNSCDVPAQSTPVPNIPASITTTPIRTPIVKPEVNDRLDHNTLPAESGLLKEKIEPAEPLLEPKTEYLEDLNNDDSVEDLTLDDDDEMDMSQMSNLSNMSRPGPSHGADLSNQGFPPWQLGNQSGTDEVFMAAQEAVNAHRDSQDHELETKSKNGDSVKCAQDDQEEDKLPKLDNDRINHGKGTCTEPIEEVTIKVEAEDILFNSEEDTSEKLKEESNPPKTSEDSTTKRPSIFIVPLESLRDKIEYKSEELLDMSSDEETESDDSNDEDYIAEEESYDLDKEEYEEVDEEDERADDDKQHEELYEDENVVMVEPFEFKEPKKIKTKKRYDNIVIMKVDQANSGYQCPSCDKLFLNFSSFVSHRETLCQTQSCSFCDFTATDKSLLAVHVQTVHRVSYRSKDSYQIFPSTGRATRSRGLSLEAPGVFLTKRNGKKPK